MTDKAWNEGMASLTVAFPYPAMTGRASAARSAQYRHDLGYLGDREWLAVVKEARRNETDSTFPTIATLLRYAASVGGALRADEHRPRTDAERDAQHRLAERGLRLIQEHVKAAPQLPPAPSHARRALPVGTMSAEVELTDERRAQLAERNREALARYGAVK